MRFRAQLIDPTGLHQLLTSISPLGTNCLISLGVTDIRIYFSQEFTQLGEQAFIDVPVESLFTSYKIESKNNNEIPFVVALHPLIHAVKCAEHSQSINIKLTKIHGRAHLSFEIGTDSQPIAQDVPIMVVPQKKVEECTEPVLPTPHVRFRMPDLKRFTQTMDHLKHSDEVTITASNDGRVVFQVADEMSQIELHYTDLYVGRPSSASDSLSSSGEDRTKPYHARVSIKKLLNVLHCRVLNASYVLACIIDKMTLVLYLKLPNNKGVVTYYIPVRED